MNVNQGLLVIIKENLNTETVEWVSEKITKILSDRSARDLYMAYSLAASKLDISKVLKFESGNVGLDVYLTSHNTNALQLVRIFLFASVLEKSPEFFTPKVANVIQVADTGELKTFLKFLILLPDPQNYRHTAVEALRTNIVTVFNAIALKNPYPSKFFNEQEWNQMYLKTAFMDQDLSKIIGVSERANADLTRIISDYAQERWAASRDINPLFWRPVSNFLEGNLLNDMERLLKSDNQMENWAGALCCNESDKAEAKRLLIKYPKIKEQISIENITWKNINV